MAFRKSVVEKTFQAAYSLAQKHPKAKRVMKKAYRKVKKSKVAQAVLGRQLTSDATKRKNWAIAALKPHKGATAASVNAREIPFVGDGSDLYAVELLGMLPKELPEGFDAQRYARELDQLAGREGNTLRFVMGTEETKDGELAQALRAVGFQVAVPGDVFTATIDGKKILVCCTPHYITPELLDAVAFARKSDIDYLMALVVRRPYLKRLDLVTLSRVGEITGSEAEVSDEMTYEAAAELMQQLSQDAAASAELAAQMALTDEEAEASDDAAIRKAAAAEAAEDGSIDLDSLPRVFSPLIMRDERIFVRHLADLGFRCVLCSQEGGIIKGRSLKAWTKRIVPGIASVGGAIGCPNSKDPVEQNLAVYGRVEIRRAAEDAINSLATASRSYIPMLISEQGGIQDLDQVAQQGFDTPELRAACKLMEDRMRGIRSRGDRFTLADVFEWIGEEVPEEFKELSKMHVGRLSARSFECGRGDVYFMLELYEYANDIGKGSIESRVPNAEIAADNGAAFIFSFMPLDGHVDVPYYVVPNCREAQIAACRKLRDRRSCRAIGITGSIGKTSTQQMVSCALRTHFDTFSSPRNTNLQTTIGNNIQDLSKACEIYVQEIGGGRPGGASRHARMIAPEAAIVTNVGMAHIGNFIDQQDLAIHKLGISEGLAEGGTLYINGDDPLLVANAPAGVNTVTYAVENHDADYYADNIQQADGKTTFDIVRRGHDDATDPAYQAEHRVPAMLNVLGEYNVLNAICAYAVASRMGVSDEEIVAGIATFQTSGTRQNLVHVCGYHLFMDCFNASPDSFESSLSVLDAMEANGGKKIAVLGEVTGQGDMVDDAHEKIGEIVKKHHPDLLACVGEHAIIFYNAAVEAGLNAEYLENAELLPAWLDANAKPGDTLLFKGSSKLHLDERIDLYFGTRFSDDPYIDERDFKTYKWTRLEYKIFPLHATMLQAYKPLGEEMLVLDDVREAPCTAIADNAAKSSKALKKAVLPPTLLHIGNGAFKGCKNLAKVETVPGIKYLGDEAFCNCSSLEKIAFKAGMIHLSDRVFAGCSSLKSVTFPGSVLQMGEDVFAGCPDNLVVSAPAGSLVEKYCKDNGIAFKAV